jgi:UDP-N-acetylmuramoylalanine--D-glutamate ligase
VQRRVEMNVVIFGMGVTGSAAATFLKNKNYSVYIYDDSPDVISKVKESGIYHPYDPALNYELGIISPGISADHNAVRTEKEKGAEIIGDLELAGRYCKNEKIIAVTGTNGKSTTVSLINHFLVGGGYKTFLCGNIGTSVLEAVEKDYEFIVIEISSFQLETLKSIHPDISLILNVSPDHLDRYQSYEEYLLTKVKLARLTKENGTLVLNGGDDALLAACKNIGVQKKYFSWNKKSELQYRNGLIYSNNITLDITGTKLRGTHNVENIMASLIAVSKWVDTDVAGGMLNEFKPLPHRSEYVDEINGVVFINDSKGTNVGATEKSLIGFDDKSVVLILGGVDKGGSYELLRELAETKCKGIVLIGEATDVIKPYFDDFYPVKECCSMKEAVVSSYKISGGSGVVLFSPACSSFDWYRNYKERGEDFTKEVFELKKEIIK